MLNLMDMSSRLCLPLRTANTSSVPALRLACGTARRVGGSIERSSQTKLSYTDEICHDKMTKCAMTKYACIFCASVLF